MTLSDRPKSEKEEQRPDQRQLSSATRKRNFASMLSSPQRNTSSTALILTSYPIAPRKSRPIEYVKIAGPLDTADALKSNHRQSLFTGTTLKGEEQVVKKAVEHPALLAMEGCNWGMLKLLCSDRIAGNTILYYDDKPNPTMPGHLNYVALGIKKIPGFKSYFDKPPSPDDFKRYDFKRGWIKSLIFRYVLAERDAHRRNFDANGLIIDLDMLIGPITGKYKDSYLSEYSRPYNEEAHKITARDILKFPDVEDFKVMFWVTKGEPYIPESVSEFISSKIVELKNNAFRCEDNEMFRSWVNDPDVHYLKFLYLLKFVLLPDAAIRQTAKDHYGYVMPEKPSSDPSKPALPIESPFIKMYTEWVINRRETVRKILVEMKEFDQFTNHHGLKALAELKEEFLADNAIVRERCRKKSDNFFKGKYDNPGMRRYDDQAMFNSLIEMDTIEAEYKRLRQDIKAYTLSKHRPMSRQQSLAGNEVANRGRITSTVKLK